MAKSILTAVNVFRHHGVRDAATFRAAASRWRTAQARDGADEYAEPLEIMATARLMYINEGRRLIDCACGAGAMVVETSEAVCFACGRIWTNLIMPPDLDTIERILLRRTFRRNQNWRPGETVAQLEAENAAHREFVTG